MSNHELDQGDHEQTQPKRFTIDYFKKRLDIQYLLDFVYRK